MAMSLAARQYEQALIALGNPQRATFAQRFFKTGAGEYGEGDHFLGLRVLQVRAEVARAMRDLGNNRLEVALSLLKSPLHEIRLFAVLMLVKLFQCSNTELQQHVYESYLANTQFINNWDLVDGSAEHIVGAWLADRHRTPLIKLARSKSVWERRMAIMATFHYIKNGEYTETLRLVKVLLEDEEELIHKAVGWMLREVGKRIDRQVEEDFLKVYYQMMPRTMLRYAIEHFPKSRRKQYLAGLI